jgi:hypothetical protein
VLDDVVVLAFEAVFDGAAPGVDLVFEPFDLSFERGDVAVGLGAGASVGDPGAACFGVEGWWGVELFACGGELRAEGGVFGFEFFDGVVEFGDLCPASPSGADSAEGAAFVPAELA